MPSGRPTLGSTAITAHSELAKEKLARIISETGICPVSARLTDSEKTRKVAPSRIDAFWSAICDSLSVLICAVRIRWIAWLE